MRGRARDQERVRAAAVYRAWMKKLGELLGAGSKEVPIQDLLDLDQSERQRLDDASNKPGDIEMCYRVLVRLPVAGITSAEVARLAEANQYQAKRLLSRAMLAGWLVRVGCGPAATYRKVKPLPVSYPAFVELEKQATPTSKGRGRKKT